MTYKELLKELHWLISEIEYREGDSLDSQVNFYRLVELTPSKLEKILYWNEP